MHPATHWLGHFLRFISLLFPSLRNRKVRKACEEDWTKNSFLLLYNSVFTCRKKKIGRVAPSWLPELDAPSGPLSGSAPSQLWAHVRCRVCGAQLVLPLCSLLLAVGTWVANPVNCSGFSQNYCIFSVNIFLISEIIPWPGSYYNSFLPFTVPHLGVQKRQPLLRFLVKTSSHTYVLWTKLGRCCGPKESLEQRKTCLIPGKEDSAI